MHTRPTAPPAHTAPQTFHLTDYLRVLYKRRWTAGLALCVVLGFSVVNTLKKTPIYEATAQILIEKDARRASQLSTVLQDQELYSDDEFYLTQHRILQSRDVAKRALDSLGWSNPSAPGAAAPVVKPSLIEIGTNWLGGILGAPKRIEPPPPDETTAQAELVSAFLGGLVIEPMRGTHLVNIHYRSPDPLRAELAANAVAREYIARTKDSRSDASNEAQEYLNRQLEDQRKKVIESDNKLAEYSESHDAVALGTPQNIVSSQLAEVNNSLVAARMSTIEKGAVWEQIQKRLGDRAALESVPAVVSAPEVVRLRADLRAAQQRVDELKPRVGAKMPEMMAATQQVETLDAKLGQEITRVVDSVRTDYETAKAKEAGLQAQLSQQKRESLSQNKKGIAYEALKRDADSNKQLYDMLLQRTKETTVTSAFKGSSTEIVDKAEIPRSPVYPNTSRDVSVGLFAGLLLAFGLAFGFEYLDSRIRTPDEIGQHLKLPFLGIVPMVAPSPTGETPLLSTNAPATFAEAVRAIRTAVIFSSAEEGARSILVTSTAPHEGKTLVASNLACALGQADQRTLIIDADLRRPRVHEVFDQRQEPGLSNVLVGTSELHEVIRATGAPNLFVMGAGHLPPNPAELLGSARFGELLVDLRHQFDWIIIDAPPVMAVTDACVIAHRTTGVVFVVGADMTARRAATFALDQLRGARAQLIGAVLNRANVERHSYYYAPYYRRDYTRAYAKDAK